MSDVPPRLSSLSIEALRARSRARPAAVRGPKAVGRTGPLPLSFGQERLWFTHKLDPASSAYNLAYALRLRGRLEIEALTTAFLDLQQRHESLRTRFEDEAGTPLQRILAVGGLRLERVEVTCTADETREAALKRVMLAEQQRSFDLSREDPIRATLMKEDEQSHVLLIVIHHIAADGWSLNIVLNELTVFYNMRVCGATCPLPPLELQFADFASWQRQGMSHARLVTQLDYWRQALQGLEPLLLPCDRPRRPVASDDGDREPFWLSQPASASLRALARRQGGTPFMALLAGYAVLLARHSNQRNFAIGTFISGRPDVRAEAVVGFFLNSVVIRVDLSGDPSFLEMLRRVRDVATQAYAHQDVPFERVVRELQPDRTLAGQPFFQTSFTLTDAPVAQTAMAGLDVSRISDERVTAQSDLALSMQSEDGRFAGVFEYATDRFDRSTVARMRDQFVRLIEAAVDSPEASIWALPMLAAEERHMLLHGWAAGERDEARYARPVVELITEQATRTPTAVAVADDRESINYGELDRRSGILAQRLVRSGVRPNDLIATFLPRGVDLVVAIVGVLKAGAAYLPLDPSFFSERTLTILKDAAPLAIVAAEGALDIEIPIVSLSDLGTRQDDRVAGPGSAGHTAGPNDLAYVIYTSGSTGRPKGAGVDNAGLSNLSRWYAETAGLSFGGRNLVVTSSAFDLTQISLLGPLTAGGCVELAAEPFDANEVCRHIVRARVTVLNLTPSVLYAIADAAIDGGFDLSCLRYVLVGGEILNLDRLRPFGRLYPAIVLANGYGPTECSDLVTVHHLPPGWSETAQMPVPIGRPIPNARCYVLDRFGEPVPIGAVGEIVIAGVCVGRGYLNRRDLTRAHFLADPFSNEVGARMYRTGDLGRWRGDGNLDFVDRADRQIKVRGFRIELADVEAALFAQPGVSHAAVVAHEVGGQGKRLFAYVVAAPDSHAFNETELRAALRARLPSYMVPQSITMLPKMPLTINGKLDWTAFPHPATASNDAWDEAKQTAPRSDIEHMLVEVWCEVLGLEQIGIDQNPFDVGADSLLLLRVIAQASKRLNRPIAVADLFRFPTIREFAEFLRKESADTSALVAEAKADAARRLRGRATPLREAR